MKVVGSRKRHLIETDGQTKKLIIRRLYCQHCDRIHHELPDQIVPFKRHHVQTIEEILSSQKKVSPVIPCEESTARRFTLWFSLLRSWFEYCLASLQALYQQDASLMAQIHSLLPLIPEQLAAGWLTHLVRLLVNTGRWRQTRSACTSV